MVDWRLFLLTLLSQLYSYIINCHLGTNSDQELPFSE